MTEAMHVLCPIDFSESSRQAMRYAAIVAARTSGKLSAMYVTDPFLRAASAAALHDRTMGARSKRELARFVDDALSPALRAACRPNVLVSTGQPATEILKAAARTRSDMIVMGTHGLTGADRLFMGSTTLGVLRKTTRPVLAVPSQRNREAPEPAATWPGEMIIAAIDLGQGSAADADVAANIAKRFGASLVLAHIVPDVPAPSWFDLDLNAHARIRMAKAERQLDRLVKRAGRQVPTTAQIARGVVADEIAALVAARRADLLVTFLKDRRGWFGSRRGEVSYHVLTHAVVPVLACPSGWRPR